MLCWQREREKACRAAQGAASISSGKPGARYRVSVGQPCEAAAPSAAQEVLAELEARAAGAGAYGLGTERYLRGGRAAAPLPPGAAWRPVSVRYLRCGACTASQRPCGAPKQCRPGCQRTRATACII